ncbi:MAG: hypothetical protein J6A16_07255 [Oscillospiraceae bacterium]|nr:hypothetical protein [Oscillospiraceae bacterium]
MSDLKDVSDGTYVNSTAISSLSSVSVNSFSRSCIYSPDIPSSE